MKFQIFSLPGVFSYNRLDPGSRVILENLDFQEGNLVLDLGCGCGVLGVLIGMAGAKVDLVDTDLYAIASAKKNLLEHQIKNSKALFSDALNSLEGVRYTHIVTNPPFHAGKSVDYQMAQAFIQGAWDHLETNGRLFLVANQFIPYDRIMKPIFRQVGHVVQRDGYTLWFAVR